MIKKFLNKILNKSPENYHYTDNVSFISVHEREKRKKETAEDFTPDFYIKKMIKRVPKKNWKNPESTFIDNSAGNGNILCSVLQHKLKYKHHPLQAIYTIFGIEIRRDNCLEMHRRIYSLVKDRLHTQKFKDKAWEIIRENIVCHDAMLWNYEKWEPDLILIKEKEKLNIQVRIKKIEKKIEELNKKENHLIGDLVPLRDKLNKEKIKMIDCNIFIIKNKIKNLMEEKIENRDVENSDIHRNRDIKDLQEEMKKYKEDKRGLESFSTNIIDK